jgi:hypothetical protein
MEFAAVVEVGRMLMYKDFYYKLKKAVRKLS